MTQLNVYLTFDGNCREAMEFYKDCLGGELELNAVGDSQMGADMPDAKDKIMHSMLKSGSIVIMASDMIMKGELNVGNNVNLCLNGGDVEELKQLFAKFSEGGKVRQPLQEAFFGLYGDLEDKFGIHWMFQAETEQSKAQEH